MKTQDTVVVQPAERPEAPIGTTAVALSYAFRCRVCGVAYLDAAVAASCYQKHAQAIKQELPAIGEFFIGRGKRVMVLLKELAPNQKGTLVFEGLALSKSGKWFQVREFTSLELQGWKNLEHPTIEISQDIICEPPATFIYNDNASAITYRTAVESSFRFLGEAYVCLLAFHPVKKEIVVGRYWVKESSLIRVEHKAKYRSGQHYRGRDKAKRRMDFEIIAAYPDAYALETGYSTVWYRIQSEHGSESFYREEQISKAERI